MDIVESCELTATVAPSSRWSCSGEKSNWYVMLYSLTWPPLFIKTSLLLFYRYF